MCATLAHKEMRPENFPFPYKDSPKIGLGGKKSQKSFRISFYFLPQNSHFGILKGSFFVCRNIFHHILYFLNKDSQVLLYLCMYIQFKKLFDTSNESPSTQLFGARRKRVWHFYGHLILHKKILI